MMRRLTAILLSIVMLLSVDAYPILTYAVDDPEGGVDQNTENSVTQEGDSVKLKNGGLRNGSQIEIRDFSAELIYGAEKTGDRYIWTPENSSRGHRFSFRVNYNFGGVGEIDAYDPQNPVGEGIRIVVPRQIIKDRSGSPAGELEISIPSRHEVETEPDTIGGDVNFAYYIDGNNIVIYNFRQVPSSENGYIELSYITSKPAYDYRDMSASDPFTARVRVNNNGTTLDMDAEDEIPVYFDTSARIERTQKNLPTLISSWNNSWGTKPADADDYYYLQWTIESYISRSTSQPYTLTFEDKTEGSLGDAEFIGYKTYGSDRYTLFPASTTFKAVRQTINEHRYDYVLTRHKKSVYDEVDKYSINNSITVKLHPEDNLDDDSSASGSRTFQYHKPIFIPPKSNFYLYKRGDGSYRSKSQMYLNYLGLEYGKYSRYDLERFQNGTYDRYDGFDYAVIIRGYTYEFTMANKTDDPRDPANYGKKPVLFRAWDDRMNLYVDGSDKGELSYEDYQLESLRYGTAKTLDADYDEETKTFKTKNPIFSRDDVLSFYVKHEGGDFVLAATENLGTGQLWHDPAYVKSMSRGKIDFRDNVTGYKAEWNTKHYFTQLDTVPRYVLKNSPKVMSLIEGCDEIWLRNFASSEFYDTRDDSKIFSWDEDDYDYARISQRTSKISKRVTGGTNNVRKKQFRIGWTVHLDEKYIVGAGDIGAISQKSGVFYDLLPSGAGLDKNSVTARNENGYINDSSLVIEQIPNYKNTGRILLKVRINEPGDFYDVYYDTVHSWEAIRDYGNDVYNPVAYLTGNDSISDGRINDGGELSDKDMMADLEDTGTAKRWLYAESRYDIQAITSAANGLIKKTKAGRDDSYSYDTWTSNKGDYSYSLRYQTSHTSRARDIVLFDSFENYVRGGQESDWKGILQSVDVGYPESMGARPVVYLSREENMGLDQYDSSTDPDDVLSSQPWVRMEEFGDITEARAIAIDLRKKADNSDFVLEPGEAVTAYLYFKAPESAEDKHGSSYPETYNNVYSMGTVVSELGQQVPFYTHQDYTTVRIKTTGDFGIKKVNAKDQSETVSGIKFRLRGTSDYGTDIDITSTTNSQGRIAFKEIERGSYILQECETSSEWLLDPTEHRVLIDAHGKVWIDDEEYSDDEITIANEPRIHGDLDFRKRREGSGTPISDTTFRLSGTSDYGNDIVKIATSESDGMVRFTDIEKGTYELREIKANDDFILNETVWTVVVDESGEASLTEPDDESLRDRLCEVGRNGSLYSLYNEPRYWGFTLRKVDKENTTVFLEGAEFNLKGISDLGTEYDLKEVTNAAGLVVFKRLERGTYILEETKAPQGVDADGKQGGNLNYLPDVKKYIVKIDHQGDVTIDGLSINRFGDHVVENDRAYDGKITVIKKWDDGLTGEQAKNRPKPVVHLVTKEPDFNSGGGGNSGNGNSGNGGSGSGNGGNSGNGSGGNSGNGSSPSGSISLIAGNGSFLSGNMGNNADFAGTDSDIIPKVGSKNAGCVSKASDNRSILERLGLVLVAYGYDGSEDDTTGWIKGWTDFGDEVEWAIDPDETLWFRPKNGATSGTMGAVALGTNMPWYGYRNRITSVKIKAGTKVSTSYNCRMMFYGAGKSGGTIDLTGLDTSNATDMASMFAWSKASAFVFGPDFDTGKVTMMQSMFHSCSADEIDVSSFDMGNVTNMHTMFYGTSVKSVIFGPSLDTSKVTTMWGMFGGATDTHNQLEAIKGLEYFDTANVTDMEGMFQFSKVAELDLSSFDTRNVTNMNYMFHGSHSGTITFGPDFDTSKVTSMYMMFRNSEAPSLDLSTFNTSEVTDMAYMFQGSKAETITFGPDFNTAKVTNMRSMFENSAATTLDLSTFKPSEATTMQGMFKNSKAASINFGSNFDTGKVTDMTEMFMNSPATSLDMSSFDTANVTNMSKMFSGSQAGILDLSSFDTGKNKSLNQTFMNTAATQIIFGPDFKTDNVANLYETFKGSSASTLDLHGFNTTGMFNFTGTFEDSAATTILGLENFDTGANSAWDIPTMARMFKGSKVENLDLSSFDTRYIRNMSEMFAGSAAKTIDISSFILRDDDRKAIATNMFEGAAVEKLVLSSGLRTSNETFKSANLSGDDWVHVYDKNGNYTYDDTAFTASKILNDLTESTDPTLSGTWIKKSSPIYDRESPGIEYISEQGVNKDNHWVILDDNTWSYTFDVHDDTIPYWMWEEEIPGYTSEVMYPNYKIVNQPVTKVATITNRSKSTRGSLLVKKTVTGRETTDRFEFTIKLEGPGISGSQVFSDVVFTDGTGRIMLAHNESKLIEGLPAGTTYSVSEKKVSSYTATQSGETGTIDASAVATADFTNAYEPPEHDPVDVTLRKTLSGRNQRSASFRFFVAFTGLAPGATYSMTNGDRFTADSKGNANAEVELAVTAAEPEPEVKILAIPVGSTYRITESGGDYSASYTVVDNNDPDKTKGTIASSAGEAAGKNTDFSTAVETADAGEDVVVAFKNRIDVRQKLTIKKAVENASDEEKDMAFSVVVEFEELEPNTRYLTDAGALTSDESGYGIKEFRIKDGEEIAIEGIPVGAVYTIKELKNTMIASFVLTDNNGDKKIIQTSGENAAVMTDISTERETVDEGENAVITFTNRHDSTTGSLRLKKVVDGNRSSRTASFEFDIRISETGTGGINGKYNAVGAGYSDLTFTDGIATVSLKHDEEIEIRGLPGGASYEVTEHDYSDQGYEVSYENNKGEINDQTVSVKATNTKDEIIPNGIFAKNRLIPIILTMIAISLMLIWRIRKSYGPLKSPM